MEKEAPPPEPQQEMAPPQEVTHYEPRYEPQPIQEMAPPEPIYEPEPRYYEEPTYEEEEPEEEEVAHPRFTMDYLACCDEPAQSPFWTLLSLGGFLFGTATL